MRRLLNKFFFVLLSCRFAVWVVKLTMQDYTRYKKSLRFRTPLKFSLLTVVFAIAITAVHINPATSQQHSLPNTPPILYVPERNWRISETEQVGQVIARIRAEDEDNDELIFGLEPHFSFNYPNAKANNNAVVPRDRLPFRIDPIEGIVYLNESLVGRGGEDFFLYITVSDGLLTAKSEVFVNILEKNDKKTLRYHPQPSNVQNISQFLPAFEKLPGVQSIRNQQPNRRPSNSLGSFGLSPTIFRTDSSSGYPSVLNFNTNHHFPIWPTNKSDSKDENEDDIESEDNKLKTTTSIAPTALSTLMTTRIKLAPIGGNINSHNATILNNQKYSTTRPSVGLNGIDGKNVDITHNGPAVPSSSTDYSIRATIISVIIAFCGLLAAAVVIIGFLYRRRLCAVSKTLTKKSKEEMAKKSNQSNLSGHLTEDSRNSMVMQHWHGPTAYGNRYVPWERDQQITQHAVYTTSQLSTSAANNSSAPPNTISTSMMGSLPNGVVVVASTSNANNNQGRHDRWEFPRHRLKFFNILGEGAFGQVWRCEATDIDGVDGVTTVAVKTLKENAAEIEKKDLVSELEVMKSLEPHVNVVRLLGCCTDKDPFFVIIEYVNCGKLQTYLRNSRAERHYGNTHGKSNVLTSGDLTSFMYQVAKGMDYLTSRGIIHRDLAARNILIMDDHTCKVADFGFARDVITSKIYERKSEGKLPIRWMAIESLYDNIFTVKSDIWSFGILMWEIVTLGSTPYPGISAADVMRKVRDGYRLEKPEHCRRELYNIMYYCWSKDPNERPMFSEVVQMLDKLLYTEMDYIELERFPDHNYYNILNLSGEKL